MDEQLPEGAPQDGGVLTIYTIPSNKAVFDVTAALDDSLTDGARGLLWRMLARGKMHGPSWKIWLKELITGCPEGAAVVKARLSELRNRGYVRRYRNRHSDGTIYWVTECSELPVFENDELKPDLAAHSLAVADTRPTKRPRKKRESAPIQEKPKKQQPQTHPAYHDLIAWWQRPIAEGGRGMTVPDRQWARVGIGVNEVIGVAKRMGWLGEAEEYESDTLILYLAECTEWIEANRPYKGAADFNNYARKLLEWWDEIGRSKYTAPRERHTQNDYMPMLIA
jgi:hypothetical protein